MQRERAKWGLIALGLATAGLATAGFFSAGAAHAACPDRIGVTYGDTLSGIAQACGINVERLRQANPGVTPNNLQAGTFLNIPRPSLPSQQMPVGRQRIPVTPSIVPPTIGGQSPTVIAPPRPIPVPEMQILRGFGNQPGQLPLPPGHSPGDPIYPLPRR